MKEVAHFFKHNTESNECFQTSDGMIFYREHDAHSHASNLKDREVKEFKRSEVAVEGAESGKEKVEAGAEGGQAGADAGAGTAAGAGAPAAKAPKAPKAK
jgi:hypothetical protein